MPDGRTPNKMPFTQSLFMGLRGDEVKRMQEWLNELNDDFKFSPKELPETGYFGFDTVHFIRDFQKFFALPPTGVYDTKTHDIVEWKFFNLMERIRIKQKSKILKPTVPAKSVAKKW